MSADLVAVAVDGWIDPERLFAARESQLPHAFWLDAGRDARTGWSYLGEGEAEPDAAAVRSVRCDARPSGEWPAGPFRGGWVGWLGYERGAAPAGAPIASPDEGIPLEVWLRAERFAAFDHARSQVWAVAPEGSSKAWAAELAARIAAAPETPAWPAPASAMASSRHDPETYASLITRCRDAIREGDAYQLCLTTRFTVPASDATGDPAAVYAHLRASSPAHHGGYVRAGDVALLSASPEQFLTVADGIARTRPIKGTRPRGADAAADAALAAELRASPKEQAENVMIVDLMRNDLSRVSEPGSIRVDGLLEVESYAAVHQLVSTVSGRLRAGSTLDDLLAACFPAGSMTGAPKLSAMTILHTLEGAARGIFAGCFGYVGHDGAADLAMIIRSIITHPGGAYVGAGGGITWGSEAAAEVAEVGIKARAPLAALGAALPPGW
ncbi:MAG TPA: anthranilate synthase component I family protein [Microbacterium sp.]|uniref:anthranilate synthase component I family protein n=1 Tax=Microbacterium sp. TaxID=51671 RepID=UPI002B7C0114|nr:anthranilate synthase component I family protein [Microbacterium sp.]HWI30396.1 anthranilate synthase component I family protein [Microbacterium sp.]